MLSVTSADIIRDNEVAEATATIYNDAELIMSAIYPSVDRNSDAFKNLVIHLACSSMVNLFVRLRSAA